MSEFYFLILLTVSSAFGEVEPKPTLLWEYKNGKDSGQVRMAQESAPDSEEFAFRKIKWTLNEKFPMLATIVQANDDGSYRATYQVTRAGGELAENWQIVLFTEKAYEKMLVDIRNAKTRKSYGMSVNTCPVQANAIWVVHNKVTKKTQGSCLTPVETKVQP